MLGARSITLFDCRYCSGTEQLELFVIILRPITVVMEYSTPRVVDEESLSDIRTITRYFWSCCR